MAAPETKVAHTPGPWEARMRTETPRSSGLSVFDPQGRSVAELTYYMRQPVDADAALIAAAPDYKKAWDEVVDVFNTMLRDKQSDSDIVAALDRILDIHGAHLEAKLNGNA